MDFTKLSADELDKARDYLRASDKAIRPTALRTLELCAAEQVAYWPVGMDLSDHSLAGRQRVINHLSQMVRSKAINSTAHRAALARVYQTEQHELSLLWVRKPNWFFELREALTAPTPEYEVAA